MNSSNSATANNKITSKLARGIISARWFILVAFVIALTGLGFYINQFRIDASADTLLVKDNKLYIQTQVADQTFNPQEFILLAYQPKGHELFSRQTFDDIEMLSARIKQIDRVEAVTSIINVPLINDTSALTGDTSVDSLTWENQRYSPAQMKQLIVGHPIFTDLLVNRQGTATGMQIVFKDNPELVRINNEITNIQKKVLKGEALSEEDNARIASLQQQADPIRQQLTETRKQEIAQIEEITQSVATRANTYLGGAYVVGQHLIDIIKSDLMTFGSAIAAVIILLLALLYRSFKWVFFPLLSCSVSVFLTMSLFGFLDMRTTVISANFVALQLILTLAVMIHIIGSYREISRDNPDFSQRQRIIATLEDKLSPCFYATLTTSVGFGSLIFSGLQPVVAFGWMMLMSMLITMAVSLLLFPALLSFLPASKETTEYRFITGFLAATRKLSLKAPLAVSAAVLALFVVAALGISRLNVENSFINYFDTDTQIHQELAFIDREFGGSTALDIVLKLDDENADGEVVLNANTVAQLQLAQAAIKAFEATGSVTSVVNFTELAKQLNGGRPLTEYELNTIYVLLDEKVVNQLVGAYFSEADNTFRISTRIQDTTEGLNRQQFMDQLNSDLQAVGLEKDQYQLTSLFVLYQDILSRLFDSQIKTLGIVYAVLAVVLFAIFRSIKVTFIALLPNVLTTLGILGVVGWAGISLDIMTITIAAIAMGIAVDDTIHFLHSYLQGMKSSDGKTATAGSESAFGHSGLAILFTSVIIATGFSLFGFSDFLPSVYFGLLTALAMLFALFTDLTLLPALLNRFVGNRKSAKAE
ncbi:efflux RND transporter permease subunit [Alteromonas confluentis]|uniref:efflux RND transporter permease subunit n=1 Tax=Alteromonas confluentis TaxID=1656094 RepID=UPI001112D0FC|nr:efflux RND transporter permease subunit [Alteromonas confluentis]